MVRKVDVRCVDFRRDDDKDGCHHADDHEKAKQDACVEQQLPNLRHSLRPFYVTQTLLFLSSRAEVWASREKERMSHSERLAALSVVCVVCVPACLLAALVGEKEK